MHTSVRAKSLKNTCETFKTIDDFSKLRYGNEEKPTQIKRPAPAHEQNHSHGGCPSHPPARRGRSVSTAPGKDGPAHGFRPRGLILRNPPGIQENWHEKGQKNLKSITGTSNRGKYFPHTRVSKLNYTAILRETHDPHTLATCQSTPKPETETRTPPLPYNASFEYAVSYIF